MYFSVVIPLYNKQNSIATTLQSVLAQTYTNYEIIVVDDGSTDDSARIAEEYIREVKGERLKVKGAENSKAETNAYYLSSINYKLIRKANGGVSSARNRGIQEAKYDYIALLDGDDLWDEYYLEEQVRLIQDFPEAKMWGVNYADINKGKIIPYQQGVSDDFRGYVEKYFETSHGDLFCSSSVVLTKDVVKKVGLQDERMAYSEDLDLWYRVILHEKVVFYNKVLAYYNKDAENRAEQNFDAHFDIKKRMEYYVDKYVPFFAKNQSFARFISLRVAWLILQGDYYFGNKYDRDATDKIVKYLAYEYMPYKYRLIFQTPRCIGRLVYEMTKLVKKIKL